MAGSTAAAIVAPCSVSPWAIAESTPSSGRRAASPGSVTTGTAVRCRTGGAQDEAGDAGLDRLGAPSGDGRIGRNDEEGRRATVDSARHRHVGGPTETLFGIYGQLDLDDDHADGVAVVEKNDNDIGAVLGWLNLGQIG